MRFHLLFYKSKIQHTVVSLILEMGETIGDSHSARLNDVLSANQVKQC